MRTIRKLRHKWESRNDHKNFPMPWDTNLDYIYPAGIDSNNLLEVTDMGNFKDGIEPQRSTFRRYRVFCNGSYYGYVSKEKIQEYPRRYIRAVRLCPDCKGALELDGDDQPPDNDESDYDWIEWYYCKNCDKKFNYDGIEGPHDRREKRS